MLTDAESVRTGAKSVCTSAESICTGAESLGSAPVIVLRPIVPAPAAESRAAGWLRLVGTGVACLALSVVLHELGICPIVKRLWTPTWVLFSADFHAAKSPNTVAIKLLSLALTQLPQLQG